MENRKVIITTDSTADMTAELYGKYNVKKIAFNVILGGEQYKDGVTIWPQTIFDHFEKFKKLPKTAAISAEEYKEFFEPFLKDGADVVHLGLSSGLSVSHDNSVTAARELKESGAYAGEVRVVDGKSLSTGTALLVLYAAELAASGKYSAGQIAEKAEKRIKHVCASFVVDSMLFLYKGGRCNGLQTLFATMLKIKPTILVKPDDGKMTPGKKYMGKIDKVIDKYVDDLFAEHKTPDLSRVFITHTFEPDHPIIERVKAKVEAAFKFKEVLITTAGSTITSHCGRGTLGVLFIDDGGNGGNGGDGGA